MRVKEEWSNEMPAAETVANPEPDMMMLNRDLVVCLAEQHRLAITIRPDGSIFGLPSHLDRLRALVKGQLARREVDLEFIIRRCQLGDEASLSLLGKATFLETYADSTRGVDLLDFVEAEHSAQRYRSWLESEFAQIWVAETTVGRSPIAYAVALTAPNDGLAREIEIKRLYVLNRFHKRGLGSCLLNEVLAHARQTGIAELFLRVQKINQNAVNFYSGRGFRVVGEETFKVGAQDHPALVMRLTLPGSGENLRIADASIMPRVTTGNTMAPCVIIGERAAEVLRAQHMF